MYSTERYICYTYPTKKQDSWKNMPWIKKLVSEVVLRGGVWGELGNPTRSDSRSLWHFGSGATVDSGRRRGIVGLFELVPTLELQSLARLRNLALAGDLALMGGNLRET
jgi:hypothetical protein